MKRSWQWYLAWGTMVASLSLLLFTMTAGPAQAWTQQKNSFTCDPKGNCSGNPSCGGSQSDPCLYWNEGIDQSVQLYFYLDPSLQNAGGYNFVVSLQEAFQQYNGISAWNPYLNIWQSGDPTFGGAYGMGLLNCGTLGATNVYGDGNIVYRYNSIWNDDEWDEWIVNTGTTFNSAVTWNNSLTWRTTSCSPIVEQADGKEAATHETGHVEGLGHTGHKAIMYPIASYATTPFETIQGDDVQGIQGIYPGIPPE